MRRSEQISAVRITSAPPGETLLWVREKWVGLELPICGPAIPRTYRTVEGRNRLPDLLFAVLRSGARRPRLHPRMAYADLFVQ